MAHLHGMICSTTVCKPLGKYLKLVPSLSVALLGLMCLSSCGGGGGSGSSGPPVADYVYQVPAQLSDGWLVSSLETEGVDAPSLTNMMNEISRQGHDDFLRNILVIKNNRLVFEEYFGGTHVDTLSHLQSATKSIVSAVYGIAEMNGFVGSTDNFLFIYFPEYQHLSNVDKDAIQLQHVLTMTPGLDWNENSAPTFDTQNDNIAAYASNNYIEYVLQKDLVNAPGTDWNYNSGCPMILAGIIKNRSGVHIDEFGDEYLLQPLGITQRRWEYQSDGLPLATGGLWLRARDAAKIGQLFLDGGLWNGQQVISAEWVDRSLTAHTSVRNGTDYGYLWWTQQRASHRLWYAAGYGGQLIILVPDSDVTIVINANYSRDTNETGQRQSSIWNLLTNFILPAI